jgi:opacity protein-like surface antigen
MYYHFVPEGSTTPYAGAGIGIDHFDPSGADNGSTRLGLNLFGGVRFPMSAGNLFMEGRYTASRYSQISLMGGVTFLGR